MSSTIITYTIYFNLVHFVFWHAGKINHFSDVCHLDVGFR